MPNWLQRLINAAFGGPTDTGYLGFGGTGQPAPYLPAASIPNLYNPVSRANTTVQEQSHFATPEVAQKVAATLGGTVAAPSVVSQAGGAASPPMQQVIVPGMAGTQNAGALYKTMKDAAAGAYKGPQSNLATNAGDNPSSAVYLIGSLAVPYDVWAKWRSTVHTEANTH
jgi:hypothetical protein